MIPNGAWYGLPGVEKLSKNSLLDPPLVVIGREQHPVISEHSDTVIELEGVFEDVPYIINILEYSLKIAFITIMVINDIQNLELKFRFCFLLQ